MKPHPSLSSCQPVLAAANTMCGRWVGQDGQHSTLVLSAHSMMEGVQISGSWVIMAPSSNLCLPPQTAHNIFCACLHVNIRNVPAQSSRRALFVIMFITLSVVGTQLSRPLSVAADSCVANSTVCGAVGAGCAGLVCCPVLP